MVEINIILKSGKEVHFVSKEKISSNTNKVALYRADDETIYTIITDEIAVSSEKNIN